MKLKLDPRTKLLILILVNVVVFFSPDIATEWICIGSIAAVLLAMGAYRQCARGLVIYFCMMTALWLCALFPGFLSAVVSMVVMVLRKVMLTVFFASGLIATTKVSELICAMQKMRMPKSIIIPFAVTVRFFPTAKEEYACIRDAMRLRGIQMNTRNIFARPLTVLECIIVPMMLRCANIAEELSAAAVTRGIDSKNKRTSMTELTLRASDAVSAAGFAALVFVTAAGGFSILYG